MAFKENIHHILAELTEPAQRMECILSLISPQFLEAYYPLTETERRLVEALHTVSTNFRAYLEEQR